MNDEAFDPVLSDTTLAELQAESGDYSEILSLIAQNQQTEIQLIKDQSALITQQNAMIADITQICYWIFFALAFYGVYKIFLGNISSWFNGC